MRSIVRQLGMVAVLATLIAGCAPSQSPALQRSTSDSASAQVVTAPTTSEATASIEVTIAPAVTVRNGIMRVTGTTDLVDGAQLNWEIGRWSDGSGESFKSGKATVTHGTFDYSASVGPIPGRKLYAFTLFASGDQPAAVRDAYGEFGQNLRGPGVYSQGKYHMIESWVVVDR